MADSALQTVDRALVILELLANHPDGLRLVDVASAMGLNKVTAHRLLSTLLARDFVERRDDNGRFFIGLRLIEISSMRLNNLELKTEAQPWLRKLVEQTGQPAHLAIYDQGEIVYIDKVETVHSIRMYSQIGKRSPVYCTALGKVLLSAMSDDEILTVLNRLTLQAYTPTTLTDPQQVLAEIQEIRKLGYALDRQEHEPGIFCVAAPIHDYRGQVIAATSTAGGRRDFLTDPDSDIFRLVLNVASSISRSLGFYNRPDGLV